MRWIKYGKKQLSSFSSDENRGRTATSETCHKDTTFNPYNPSKTTGFSLPSPIYVTTVAIAWDI